MKIIRLLLPLLLLVASSAWAAAAPDFRQVHWGQSLAEVLQSESSPPGARQENALFYRTDFAGLNCILVYMFDNDRLYQAGYIFDLTHDDLNQFIFDYKTLFDRLGEEFGKPEEDQVLWLNETYRNTPRAFGTAVSLGHLVCQASWRTPATIIRIRLWGADRRINLGIGYFSLAYEELSGQKIKAVSGL
jgi:hypothetical protein